MRENENKRKRKKERREKGKQEVIIKDQKGHHEREGGKEPQETDSRS